VAPLDQGSDAAKFVAARGIATAFKITAGSFDRLPLVGGKLVAGEPAPIGAWLLSGRVSD
jgi:hypothetical protein